MKSRLFAISLVAMLAGVLSAQQAKAPRASDDPFAAPTKKQAAQGDDPFAAGNPFAQGRKAKTKKKKAVASNPFGTGDPYSSGRKKAPKSTDDPFAAGAKNQQAGSADPFGGGSPKKKKAKLADPFASGADPFGDDSKKQVARKQAAKKQAAKKKPATRRSSSIREAFNQETTLQFVDAPLREVVDFLKTLHKVPIYVDVRAIEEGGLGPDTPVNLHVKGVTFRDGLNVLCDGMELDWLVDNEVIYLTSKAAARRKERTAVYDASALVAAGAKVDDIAKLFTSLLRTPGQQTGSRLAGGAGGMMMAMAGPVKDASPRRVFVHRKSLVVRATEGEHHMVTGVLHLLSEHQRVTKLMEKEPTQLLRQIARTGTRLHSSKATTRIEQALEQETSLEFVDSPLREVLDYLTTLHKVPTFLDLASLEEIGLGSDTPVNQNLNGISLRSGLNLMLDELGMTWIVRNGMLTLVTQEEARLRPIIKAYLVSDLVSAKESVEQLQEIVSATVRLTMRARRAVNKRAAIDRRQVIGFQNSLIIAATEEDHDRVSKVLAMLRSK